MGGIHWRAAAFATLFLSACGGDGATPSRPSGPVGVPSPTSTPLPTPTPSSPLADCAAQPLGTEHWPEWNPGDRYAAKVQQVIALYNEGRYDWRVYQLPGAYRFDGQYVTIAPFDPVGPGVRFDDLGVPMVQIGDEWHYNPTTIANFALWHHTRFLKGVPLPSSFWAAVGTLQRMIGSDGAIRYTYAFDGMEPGWVSAMAQGQVLSVFSRAYLLSGDPSLISQGNAVLAFMLKPVNEGGTRSNLSDLDPSLDNYLALDEYAHHVSPHTLNGFMFALFGLYDWAKLGERAQGVEGPVASAYFSCGIQTLVSTLPYYDIGGFSTYDLKHVLGPVEPSVGPVYHRIHIAELAALYSVTGRSELVYWARHWARSDQPVP